MTRALITLGAAAADQLTAANARIIAVEKERDQEIVAYSHRLDEAYAELDAANAAIRERDERLAEIAKVLRSTTVEWQKVSQAIALAEKRTEAGHE